MQSDLMSCPRSTVNVEDQSQLDFRGFNKYGLRTRLWGWVLSIPKVIKGYLSGNASDLESGVKNTPSRKRRIEEVSDTCDHGFSKRRREIVGRNVVLKEKQLSSVCFYDVLRKYLEGRGLDVPSRERVKEFIKCKDDSAKVNLLMYDWGYNNHDVFMIISLLKGMGECKKIFAKKKGEYFFHEKKMNTEHSVSGLEEEFCPLLADTLVIGSELNDRAGNIFDKTKTVFAGLRCADLEGDVFEKIDVLFNNPGYHGKFKHICFANFSGDQFDNKEKTISFMQKVKKLLSDDGYLVIVAGCGYNRQVYTDSKTFVNNILCESGFDKHKSKFLPDERCNDAFIFENCALLWNSSPEELGSGDEYGVAVIVKK